VVETRIVRVSVRAAVRGEVVECALGFGEMVVVVIVPGMV